jgi:hypothetical protein
VYFAGHWGRHHPFYWGAWWPCGGYGYRSWFFYNGAYFDILAPVPDFWCGDAVYIDEYGDEYILVNPVYPGVYYRLGVRF